MELKQLTEEVCKLLGVKGADEITDWLYEIVTHNETEFYEKFANIVGNDLDTDWLQMIFQYYQADRESKKQDYTPRCIAKLMSVLAGQERCVMDLCAGTGALTIQCWKMDKESYHVMREVDQNVIPWLLFNMAVRNIDCEVHHEDALQQKLYALYRIYKGEKFGTCEVIYQDECMHI